MVVSTGVIERGSPRVGEWICVAIRYECGRAEEEDNAVRRVRRRPNNAAEAYGKEGAAEGTEAHRRAAATGDEHRRSSGLSQPIATDGLR